MRTDRIHKHSGEGLALPNQWPEHSTIARSFDRPTVLVALHPRCVCSRATVEELARILARLAEPPRVEVLLYRPENSLDSSGADPGRRPGAIAAWCDNPARLERPRVRTVSPLRFRTDSHLCSRQTFNFYRGITRGRGHEGDNAGSDAILSILAKHSWRSQVLPFLVALSGVKSDAAALVVVCAVQTRLFAARRTLGRTLRAAPSPGPNANG